LGSEFKLAAEKHMARNLAELAMYRVIVGLGLGVFLGSALRFLAGFRKTNDRRD
jgi:hypothetical protein